jgi:uncharacterized C2H2 Zn-finger protein
VGPKGGKPRCPYCGDLFSRPVRLHEHMMSRHPFVYFRHQDRHSCEECHRTFVRAHDLQRHFSKVHGSSDREKATCPSCNAVYADRRSMLRHQRHGCHTANSKGNGEPVSQKHDEKLGKRLYDAAQAAALASSSSSPSESDSSSSQESKRGAKKRNRNSSSALKNAGACRPCRQRKVKCTKTLPCLACVRTGMREHCSYEQPSRKHRTRRSPVLASRMRVADHTQTALPATTENASASWQPGIAADARQSLEDLAHGSTRSPTDAPSPNSSLHSVGQQSHGQVKQGYYVKQLEATIREREEHTKTVQVKQGYYVKQLEATIREREEHTKTVQSLQESHRQAADECLMLRYKNSLLERILLSKGLNLVLHL